MKSQSTFSTPTGTDTDTILIIAEHGFRQINLLAILRLLPDAPRLLCAETRRDVEQTLAVFKTTMIILDYSLPDERLETMLALIRQLDCRAWVLLLAAHPCDAFTFQEHRPDAILWNGFSYTQLIDAIQKAKLYQFMD